MYVEVYTIGRTDDGVGRRILKCVSKIRNVDKLVDFKFTGQNRFSSAHQSFFGPPTVLGCVDVGGGSVMLGFK